MSDKSFGDHINRGVVKNPLLSNVVTGLSLDDLTQKAVLLPVSPTLGVIAGSEHNRPTLHTLAHAQHDQPIFSSGDADKNLPSLTPSNEDNATKNSEAKNTVRKHESNEKTLAKEDDFDVNEYFARLQGTRYVSAPLHSEIKDDQNSNTEENLEEINLNEPDKPQDEVLQQSLTADIAQNFSQLPAVLPHVASAVFSSFSNMLSLKGREQTPESSKSISGYREVDLQNPHGTTVPLMSVEEPLRDIGPPPKEPPTGGNGNYRITTKKKYAQIPGLTCGDTGHNIYSAPLNTNAPPSFTSTHIERDKVPENFEEKIDREHKFKPLDAATVPAFSNFESNLNAVRETGYLNPVGINMEFNLKDMGEEKKEDEYNIFNPGEDYIRPVSNIFQCQEATEIQPKFYDITSKKEQDFDGQPTNQISTQNINEPFCPTPLVPPPPMFSNIPRDKPPIGKSILPPSVARRIATKQPIVKPQSVAPPIIDNIFTPTLDHDTFHQLSSSAIFPDDLRSKESTDTMYLPSTNIIPQAPSQITTEDASSTFYTTIPDIQTPPEKKAPASNTFASKLMEPSIFISALENSRTNLPSVSTSSSKIHEDSNTELFFAPKQEPQKLPSAVGVPDQSNFGLSSSIPSFGLPAWFTPDTPISNTSSTEYGSQNLIFSKAPDTSELPMFDMIQPTFDASISKPSGGSNVYPPVISQPQPSAPSISLFDPSQIQNASKEIRQADQAMKFFEPSTLTSEPFIPITEPPKASNSFNYRMSKKKPQYYSGPIAGVGSISNNFKPIIPSVESDSFRGALFTPEQQPLTSNNMGKCSIMPASSKPTQIDTVPFDISKVQVQPEYNTSFDFSRQTMEMDIPKEESKGFGIIGSLKSKLSSIDINKIQNSVSAFFDPAYNDIKTNTTNKQENYHYYQKSGNEQNSQNRRPSFEVFVPEIQHTFKSLDAQIPHDAPHSYHNTEQMQNSFNSYPNQQQSTIPVASYFAYPNHGIPEQLSDIRAPIDNNPDSYFSYTDIYNDDRTKTDGKILPNTGSNVKIVSMPGADCSDTQTDTVSKKQKGYDEPAYIPKLYKEKELHDEKILRSIHEFPQSAIKTSSNLPDRSFFDTPLLDNQTYDDSTGLQSNLSKLVTINNSYLDKNIDDITSNIIKPEMETFPVPTLEIAKQDKLLKKVFDTEEKNMQVVAESKSNFIPLFQNASTNTEVVDPFIHIKPTNQELGPEIQLRETNLLESLSTDEIPIVAVSSVPLFGLSTIIPEKPKESFTSESKKSEGSLSKAQRPYDKKAIARFFENIPPREVPVPREIKKPNQFNIKRVQEAEKESELNICETCREVNKHEEKETEDLTTQLIENITAPIQLSNPVETPFTDGETTQNRVEFDRDQFEKISHITEDTIESIHVHSASELLDNVPSVKPKGRSNFVWSGDNSTSEEDDDYKLIPKPPSGVLFQKKLKFYETVVSNVIGDIKTEFNVSNEVKQANAATEATAPTATQSAEDDLRAEAAGNIDVFSIELDASKDFPLYIIEPSNSEDDDSSVDMKEIVKFEDTGIKMESFTNRIERFKKREETKVDNPEIYGIKLSSVNSPSIPIASYFDTGNYAAETHYKNSLYSPSFGNYMGSPSQPMRIPPGFEDEYQRRLSGLSSQVTSSYLGSDSKSDEPVAPEVSKHTSTTVTTTHVAVDNSDIDDSFDVQSHLTNFVDDIEPPSPPKSNPNKPILATMFGSHSHEVDTEYKDTMAMQGSDDMSPTEPPYIFDMHKVQFPPRPSDSESFSRLASYFDSPPNTEHSKSFFELSQSENHYRHKSNENETRHDNTSSNSDHEIRNIQDDSYVANFDLMKDLTSVDNIQIPKQFTDKIVHYFTVEYDNDVKKFHNESNINNKSYNTNDNFEINDLNETNRDANTDKITNIVPFKIDNNRCNCETLFSDTINNNKNILKANAFDDKDNENFHTAVNKCDICTDYVNFSDGSYKIRKFMNDSKGSGNKGSDNIMMQANEDTRKSVTANFDIYPVKDDNSDEVTVLTENRTTSEYTPVKHHWFYRVDIDDKSIWRGFSVVDSAALEDAYRSQQLTEETVVPTDGGRYDVNIVGRIRRPVYWSDKPTNVRRCSWFYKGTTDARYVPYTENVAEKLEEEYRHGMRTGEWHRQLILPNNELVVMHGPSVMVHFLHSGPADAFSTSPLFTFGKRVYRNPPKIRVAKDQPEKIDHLILLVHGAGEYRSQKEKTQSTSRPRVVRRGHDESEIEDTEPSSIDHLLLLCHGVGSACDMRFRNVEEVVDDFRATSLQLVQSHYRNSYENGTVNRVEVLPISWHSTLHSGENGVDRRLAQITLDSIPRLRNFTNDTVLDVLFYTSPVYCQTIIDTVCNELNRIYTLFLQRNPKFTGGVSLGGHSLGSVILYDLLCHQESKSNDSSAEKSYVTRSGGCTGQPNVIYPKLVFDPAALYALGSPIAIFECIRGVESLGMDFALPTCNNFFNIFHPYDPIAYRIEPLINPQLRNVKPFLVPHHKGRKRMHLELKDTMVRVGADLKQKFIESIRTTWNKWKTQTPNDGQLEKVVEEEMEKEQLNDERKEESTQNETATPDMLGKLNGGRRIDYVLQEAPLEVINEYLFAMSSHVGYWESEDTMLLMLREIYDVLGVQPDSTIPQQNMTIQRTRTMKQDETIVIDQPTTSRGSP